MRDGTSWLCGVTLLTAFAAALFCVCDPATSVPVKQVVIIAFVVIGIAISLLLRQSAASPASMLMWSDTLACTCESAGLQANGRIESLPAALDAMSTKLKIFSERERLIFDFGLHLVCKCDSDLRLLQLNQVFASSLGYGRPALFGVGLSDLVVAADMDAVCTGFGQSKALKKLQRFTCQMRKANGDLSDFDWRVEWSDKSNSFYCIAQDVSAEKRLERLKAEMTAIVTHDLRHPLASLSFFLQNLLLGTYGDLSGDITESLERGHSSILTMLKQVDSVLDANKLESGMMTTVPGKFDCREIISTVMSMVGAWAQEKKVTLQVEITEPTIVFADADQCAQIFGNLLSNAIKWSAPGSSVVIRTVSDERFITVEIQDAGPGVSDDIKETLFERFSSVHQEQNLAPAKSSGLGLYIARQFCRLQGGAIGFRPNNDSGSTFWFTLPKPAT